jgi:murein DD-endopeptidase MepM/ murein hydrolase activator NlpD
MIAIAGSRVFVQADPMTYRALLLAVTVLLAPAPPAPAPASSALASALPRLAPALLPRLAPALLPRDPADPSDPTDPVDPVAPGDPAYPDDPAGRGGYRWPVAGQPVVTRGFSPPPRPWLAGHRGVDIAGTPGEVIRAAGSGVVAFAGEVAGTGVVSVDHPGGLRTTYEPVAALVHAGQPVVAGQPIGTLAGGHPGCPVAACLHWGLRRGAEYLDPLLLLHAAPVRLYPASGSGP